MHDAAHMRADSGVAPDHAILILGDGEFREPVAKDAGLARREFVR